MKEKKEKILIIKTGHSETLVGEVSRITSLGDVLRSTVLLHLYKDADVSWLVDEKAFPLLKDNLYISRIMSYDLTSVLQLQRERFDTVINLEKVPGLCAFSDSINGWRRYGFRFCPETGVALAHDGSQHVIELCLEENQNRKKDQGKYWEKILFEMVGREWKNESCMLGYKPLSKIEYDVGFNCDVGNKWPTKAWPKKYWNNLEKIIGNKYSISWQQGKKNIEEYFEWINSCRVIVTNDSLGLHVACALGKKIVALFGPTISSEVYVPNGVKLLPKGNYSCLPCLSAKCSNDIFCMSLIKPKTVFEEIKNLLR